jgi:hypothetical protein
MTKMPDSEVKEKSFVFLDVIQDRAWTLLGFDLVGDRKISIELLQETDKYTLFAFYDTDKYLGILPFRKISSKVLQEVSFDNIIEHIWDVFLCIEKAVVVLDHKRVDEINRFWSRARITSQAAGIIANIARELYC